ncbi:hypothetical protein [Streptomyces coeruleorubidus]|uniref:hypothetical protein n=1 Tax=Streptomyces coeruleorubidus TaxID=116188 RepID=UPI0036682EE3
MNVLEAAALIPSPFTDVEWSGTPHLQCLLEDVPHDFHAAFLRTGAGTDPDTDVFVCWRDGSATQWLEDIEVCLLRAGPLDTGCTVYRLHPGRCDWQYIDPAQVALQAEADQLAKALGLSRRIIAG